MTLKMIFVVQGDYGHGWEDLTTATTRREAWKDVDAYRHSEAGTPIRLIRRRKRPNE
jgi:hypothetical protein